MLRIIKFEKFKFLVVGFYKTIIFFCCLIEEVDLTRYSSKSNNVKLVRIVNCAYRATILYATWLAHIIVPNNISNENSVIYFNKPLERRSHKTTSTSVEKVWNSEHLCLHTRRRWIRWPNPPSALSDLPIVLGIQFENNYFALFVIFLTLSSEAY